MNKFRWISRIMRVIMLAIVVLLLQALTLSQADYCTAGSELSYSWQRSGLPELLPEGGVSWGAGNSPGGSGGDSGAGYFVGVGVSGPDGWRWRHLSVLGSSFIRQVDGASQYEAMISFVQRCGPPLRSAIIPGYQLNSRMV